MRAYFGLRSPSETSVSASDADAVVLAATCAALRGDREELQAVSQILGDGELPHVLSARKWIETLLKAAEGDVARVAADIGSGPDAIPRSLGPALILLAAENGSGPMDATAEGLLRGALESAAPDVRPRLVGALARSALARGDRMATLTELEAMPEKAPPVFAFLASLGAGRAEMEKRWREVPEGERAAAAAFVAAFAVGASPAFIEAAHDVVGSAADARTSATLTAELILARARGGDTARAVDLATAQTATNAAPLLAAACAHALVAAGRAQQAKAVLAKVDNDELTRDLALTAAIAANDDARFLELLGSIPHVVPASETRGAVAAYLVNRREIPASLPPWIDQAPDDPAGLYAWALFETRRGHGATAVAAFARAIAARRELEDLGDAPQVAGLLVARDALRAHDFNKAEAALAVVRSRRLDQAALTLRGMLLVRRAAANQQVRIDADTFGQIARELLGASVPHTPDHAALTLLAKEADVIRAAWLLRERRWDDARPVVARLSPTDVDGAFLRAVLAIADDRDPATIERELARAVELHPDARVLSVLLAEVRGAYGGADARVAALEQLRKSAGADALVEEALASAYGGARRGLDAKRVALEEMRRRGKLGSVLSSQLRDALAFEAPPARRRTAASVADAERRVSLPTNALKSRAHLLVRYAQEKAATASSRREIEAALQRFKHALLSDDLVVAASIEAELLAACSGQSEAR